MFEVGKQYRGQSTGKVVEVLCVGNETTFVRIVNQGAQSQYREKCEYTIPNGDCDNYYPHDIRDVEMTVVIDASGKLRLWERTADAPPMPPFTTVIGTANVSYNTVRKALSASVKKI